ncbi:TPR repeat [Lacrimispora sphenoides]|nr:TPR repeat [Lacrimispora sphenoides]
MYYIATREGVDLQPLEKELNAFEKNMKSAAENEAYIKYINERPRSNGLFGNINTNDVNGICNYMKKISSKRCVFRGIISLGQEDAEDLNFTNKESWAKFLHENLPDIGETFGISNTNLAWVASFHNEQRHPHVHFMLWSEAKEQHIKPFISIPQQHKCRELLSKQMFKQEREQYVRLKTDFRDLLTKSTQKDIKLEVDSLKQEVLGIPEYRSLSRINKQLLSDSTQKILELVEAIPPEGSLKYRFMPPEVKEKINSLVSTILSKYELQDEYKKFLKYTEQMALTYSPTEKKQQVTLDKAKKDIDTRLGNIVLNSVKELRTNKDLYFSVIDSKSEFELIDPMDSIDEFDSSGQEFDLSASPEINYSEHSLSNGAVFIKWNREFKAASAELYADSPDFDKALSLFDVEHRKGNILATYEIGKIYERNLAGSDPELAAAYYQEALSGFHTIYNSNQKQSIYAAYRLGKMYQYGQGTDINIESAKSWYEKADNNVYAQYALAKILMSEARENDDFNNKSHIVNLLKSSSKKNNYAANELGRIYHEGLFDKKNPDLSQKYYKQAFDGFSEMLIKSEKNDDLLYRLGKMHQLGLGTDVDIEQATLLFEKAAALKNTNALYSLSKIYIHSNDEKLLKKAIKILEELYKLTPENHLVSYALGSAYSDPKTKNYDIHKAINFLEHAAELGNDFAMLKLGNIYSGPAEKHPELPANIPLAISYLEKSANLGNSLAMYSLGKIFSDKDSGHYDIRKAIEHLERAASLGNDFAMLKLGSMYSDSTDKYPELLANISLAISYLEESANMGNHQAMYSLGKLLSDPDTSYYDIHKAIDFLERSADLGNDFAMLKLGNIYLWGKGVPQDKEKGILWLDKSAAAGNEYAEKSKQAYETFEEEKATQQVFSLFGNLLRSLCYSNNKARNGSLYTDKGIKGNKKALRENARKNPYKHSQAYEPEV